HRRPWRARGRYCSMVTTSRSPCGRRSNRRWSAPLMSEWRRGIDSYIESHAERWTAIRRHLHIHPEPSLQEFETTRYLAAQLSEAGVPVQIAPSGRGLIAEPGGQGEAARVAIRADTDALRIQDAKSVAYRSSRDGLMHACGHDAHAAMAVAAASALMS